jgi:hypothetical protein
VSAAEFDPSAKRFVSPWRIGVIKALLPVTDPGKFFATKDIKQEKTN